MRLVLLHSKAEIETFTRKNPLIHLYEIGDLDDFFWPNTIWYALKDSDEIKQLALLYTAQIIPVLIAHAEEPVDMMDELLQSLLPFLLKKFYGHMSERSADFLSQHYEIERHGTYLKMGLLNSSKLAPIDTSGVLQMTKSDSGELLDFYKLSYPGNWFDPRMLETRFYYGIRREQSIVSVAGVHVFSKEYRVAALGNVATHPKFRGQGLATAACARLCNSLRAGGVEEIGLNVKADNFSAIASYQKIGFEKVAEFGEYTFELK
ncbi:GNAT family N-acetyltransferase [Candidatus Acetothermia bacterium]|nr:GNAT family N-acetyltransferase [Candidatus Acetothermia bacterium]MBI3642660.1 GNAT family N-acetyltransferase [Candidatus Acetothermia bacterium]